MRQIDALAKALAAIDNFSLCLFAPAALLPALRASVFAFRLSLGSPLSHLGTQLSNLLFCPRLGNLGLCARSIGLQGKFGALLRLLLSDGKLRHGPDTTDQQLSHARTQRLAHVLDRGNWRFLARESSGQHVIECFAHDAGWSSQAVHRPAAPESGKQASISISTANANQLGIGLDLLNLRRESSKPAHGRQVSCGTNSIFSCSTNLSVGEGGRAMGVGVGVSSLHRQALAPQIPQKGDCAPASTRPRSRIGHRGWVSGAHRATIEPCRPIREGGSSNTPFIIDDADDGINMRDIG